MGCAANLNVTSAHSTSSKLYTEESNACRNVDFLLLQNARKTYKGLAKYDFLLESECMSILFVC